MTLQRSPRAALERYRIENDTLKSWTQKASGLEPLSKSGMKLMRLFLSPSVSLLLILQRQRAAEGLGSGAVPHDSRSGKQTMLTWREGGRWPLCQLQKEPSPRGGSSLDACTCDDQSRQWSQGGRKTRGLIHFSAEQEMGWFPSDCLLAALSSDLTHTGFLSWNW